MSINIALSQLKLYPKITSFGRNYDQKMKTLKDPELSSRLRIVKMKNKHVVPQFFSKVYVSISATVSTR